MLYEKLLVEAIQHGVDIYEKPMPSRLKGLYADNVIWINSNITTNAEKTCILAEELGHHFTSSGDILDQISINNRKQEKKARYWAYEKLVPLEKIIQAYHAHISSKYELAQYLNVTEEFLQLAINRYKEKYGLYKKFGRYIIYFDPLGIVERFD